MTSTANADYWSLLGLSPGSNSDQLKTAFREHERSFEDDKSSRKDWEDQYSKGLKMLGVVVEDRQAPFPGASGVHHPLMSEAATQFQARAISEMFPAGGPVKTQIVGKQTDKKLILFQNLGFLNFIYLNPKLL